MPVKLLLMLGALGFVVYETKFRGPSVAPPTTPATGGTAPSGQPGIQSLLTQALQAMGIGPNTGSAQNTNQAPYGGSKQFMGTPATPVSTQIVNAAAGVNWGSVGNNISSMWDNLFGDEPSTDSAGFEDFVDPSPDLNWEMDGFDTVDASDAWNTAADYGYDDGWTYDSTSGDSFDSSGWA